MQGSSRIDGGLCSFWGCGLFSFFVVVVSYSCVSKHLNVKSTKSKDILIRTPILFSSIVISFLCIFFYLLKFTS